MHPSAARAPHPCLSYDFVADRAHDGKAFRMLCIIDVFARERLANRCPSVRDQFPAFVAVLRLDFLKASPACGRGRVFR